MLVPRKLIDKEVVDYKSFIDDDTSLWLLVDKMINTKNNKLCEPVFYDDSKSKLTDMFILKEDVINLGYKNDIVKVKDGYGRNFLIPTGKAVIATASAKKVLAEELKQRAHKLAKIKADAEELAQKLAPVSLTIATKVSATGAIYGSVGSIQIAEELAKLGFEIDRKIIVVEAAKEVGNYTATIKLHKEVSVKIPFAVVAEESAE